MKKFILLAVLCAGISFNSFSQSNGGVKIDIGPDFGIPTGQANTIYNLVYGGFFKVEAPISAQGVNVTVGASYNVFKVNSNYSGLLQNSQYLPVMAGLKDYINNSRFYVSAEAGVSFAMNDNYTGPKAAFAYAPGIGILFPAQNIDLGLRYEGRVESGGTISQFALRLAYRINTH